MACSLWWGFLWLVTVLGVQWPRHDVSRLKALERQKDLLTQLLELKDLKLQVGTVPYEAANARLNAIESNVNKIAADLRLSALETGASTSPNNGRGFFMQPVIDYGSGAPSQSDGAKLMASIIGTEPASAASGPAPVVPATRDDVLDPSYCTKQAAKVAAMKAEATQALQDAIAALQAQLPTAGSTGPAVCASCGSSGGRGSGGAAGGGSAESDNEASGTPEQQQSGGETQPSADDTSQATSPTDATTTPQAVTSPTSPTSANAPATIVTTPTAPTQATTTTSIAPSQGATTTAPSQGATTTAPSQATTTTAPSQGATTTAPTQTTPTIAPTPATAPSIAPSQSTPTTQPASPTASPSSLPPSVAPSSKSVAPTASPTSKPAASAFVELKAAVHKMKLKFAAHLRQELDLLAQAGCVKDPDELWASSIAGVPIE